jgi:hypothetical protein
MEEAFSVGSVPKLYNEDQLPKAPNAVHGPLGITHRPTEKANVNADCLEIQFTSHDLRDENRE